MTKIIASRQVGLIFYRLQTWIRHIVFSDRSNYQNGFIPLMIMLIAIIAAIIWLAFIRVHNRTQG